MNDYFLEMVPPQQPEIGSQVMIPIGPGTAVAATVVEWSGPDVIIQLPSGEKMLGKYGNCRITGNMYEGVWNYFKYKQK